MKAFAALYGELDASTSTARKVEAMRRYFERTPAADAAWAAYFLAGGKPRRVVSTMVLRRTA
ncbi:MAG: ATP-dependent DNA ligase, partial [Aquincola sp.]|nr:ATP-dependent DNA ligase [Aquincola sp.]